MEPTRPTLTPRPDWTMPPTPEGREPYAYLVDPADGWDLYFAVKDADDPDEDRGGEIPWPFDNDAVAEGEDFEALGFVVGG